MYVCIRIHSDQQYLHQKWHALQFASDVSAFSCRIRYLSIKLRHKEKDLVNL